MKFLFLSCPSIAGHKSSHSLLLFILFYWLTWVDVLAVFAGSSHLKHRNPRLSFKYTCFLPRRQEGSFQDASLLSSSFDGKMTNFYFLYPQNLVLVILIWHLGDKDWIFSNALWMLLCWVLTQIPAARTKCLWKVKRSAWEIWFIQIGSGFISEVQTSKFILLGYPTLCLLVTSNHNFTQFCTLFWISDVACRNSSDDTVLRFSDLWLLSIISLVIKVCSKTAGPMRVLPGICVYFSCLQHDNLGPNTSGIT